MKVFNGLDLTGKKYEQSEVKPVVSGDEVYQFFSDTFDIAVTLFGPGATVKMLRETADIIEEAYKQ